jgi:GNAT superfamily N-acetyltransferase
VGLAISFQVLSFEESLTTGDLSEALLEDVLPITTHLVWGKPMVEIIRADSPASLDDARMLMRAFVAWHRATSPEDIELIDRYFDKDEFERELRDLPGRYEPPSGRLLVAYVDRRTAGCVAMHDLGSRICEMKRMFVSQEFRGLGVGRALCDRVTSEARAEGYHSMRLDTGKRQTEAMRLYEYAGFKRIAPYYPVPEDFKNYLFFYELAL